MAAVFTTGVWLGSTFTTVLFGGLSFLAMREFIALTQDRTCRPRGAVLGVLHHPAAALLPGRHSGWYGLFTILIPVYAFAFIPFRRVLTGETKNFLSSTARIQWALLVCVYAVSHMPMMLSLPLKNYEGQNAKLLFFLCSPRSSATCCNTSGARPAANARSPRWSARTRPGKARWAASARPC